MLDRNCSPWGPFGLVSYCHSQQTGWWDGGERKVRSLQGAAGRIKGAGLDGRDGRQRQGEAKALSATAPACFFFFFPFPSLLQACDHPPCLQQKPDPGSRPGLMEPVGVAVPSTVDRASQVCLGG